jgi:hypothetical protein
VPSTQIRYFEKRERLLAEMNDPGDQRDLKRIQEISCASDE